MSCKETFYSSTLHRLYRYLKPVDSPECDVACAIIYDAIGELMLVPRECDMKAWDEATIQQGRAVPGPAEVAARARR